MANDKQWNGKSRGGKWGHIIFLGLLKTFGLRSAYVLLAFIIFYYIPFSPKSTKALWLYYRRRWGFSRCKSVIYIYKHYYVFGQTLIDKVAIRMGLKNKFSFDFEEMGELMDLVGSEQGIIIIGAHIGCWEVSSAFFGNYGKKINIVMYDKEYQEIKDVIEKGFGREYKVIPLTEDNIETVISIKKALMDNEYVCFQGDRYLHKDSILKITILGQEAKLPKGPFLIASKMKVPVVFYFSVREKGRKYRFISKSVPYSKDNSIEYLVSEYKRLLDNILVKYKTQWFNMYNYWEE